MGNFVSDKNVVKTRSLPFDPPNSPAALHQFLSQYPNDLGVKLEGAFVAPVVKVRTHEPKKLDAQSREVWSFYLLNMQQRLAGTEHAQLARDAVQSLLKTEPLKLSVGKLLGPLKHLMDAEQERLSSANSFVRRWVAKEKLVLQIAVPHDHDASDANRKKENREREAIMTACSVLSKFKGCEDGDIDTARIRDEAYAIGHDLSKADVDALCSARMNLMLKMEALGGSIGPEVPLLISLCIAASDKTESEFRSDESTKRDVFNIMRALKARSDIDEYHTPTPPGTVADRKVRRLSMPVFAAPETTASNTLNTSNTSTTSTPLTTPRRLTPEKGAAVTDTAPPAKSLPSTPRRDLSGSNQGGQFTPFSPSSSTPADSVTYGRNAGSGLNMGAAITELKSRQKTTAGASGDNAWVNAEPGSPPVTPRVVSRETSLASASANISSSAGSTSSPKTPSGRKRLDDASRSDAIRQKSDGDDMLLRQPKRAKPPKRRVKSMESRLPDAADQTALDTARTAARTLNADMLKALTDTAIYKKWVAAEQQLHADLAPEASKAVGRLISYCHKVKLEQGEEQASLDRVINTLRPQVKEVRAFIVVRDLLLAESRGQAGTKAASAFPELLSLLVFAIDAERKWRQEHDSKAYQ
jgi:hypothetical protein